MATNIQTGQQPIQGGVGTQPKMAQGGASWIEELNKQDRIMEQQMAKVEAHLARPQTDFPMLQKEVNELLVCVTAHRYGEEKFVQPLYGKYGREEGKSWSTSSSAYDSRIKDATTFLLKADPATTPDYKSRVQVLLADIRADARNEATFFPKLAALVPAEEQARIAAGLRDNAAAYHSQAEAYCKQGGGLLGSAAATLQSVTGSR